MRQFQTHHYTGGANRLVSALVAEGQHTVEAWGNAREGFTPYLVSNGSGVPVGPWFRRLSDLRDGVRCAYGLNVTVKQGRGW